MSIKKISFVLVLAVALVTLAGIPAKPQFQTQDQNPTLFSGRNVNMVSGTTLPDGDPWLQRQNEPSLAVSTRNPLHLLAGANDYRTIDMPDDTDPLPGLPEGTAAAKDAWLGVFKSFDGGQSWITTLLPGFPQDSPGSPLYGYEAAADPVVRAGVNGLFYYSGIVFNRGEPKESAVFIARFIDNNNDEEADTIHYLDTTIIDLENGGTFKDKPWIAVDAPRKNSGTTTIDGQEIPIHNVYIVYTVFTEKNGKLESQILFRRSTDCGLTWENPIEINKNNLLNQGATIAVNPRLNGHIYVAWRRFSSGNGKNAQTNAIVAARSTNEGKSFSSVDVVAEINNPFDQGTSIFSFRTNSYPSIAVDDKGTIYAAWAQQEVDPSYPDNSRIVISTSNNTQNWTAPAAVETPFPDLYSPNPRYFGHQFMPSLTFASGKLMMVWYDTRNDYCPDISPSIDDNPLLQTVRHTIDVRVAQADPGDAPLFEPSIQVSRYLWALNETHEAIEQVRFNPPNYPLFKGGTVPFHGDYVDIAPSPSFVQDRHGNWQFNTEPSGMPIFHIAWVDNRDVRPPDEETNHDWTIYNPPTSAQQGCVNVDPFATGMRNQNVYTSRITTAVEVGSPKNNKHLGTLGVDPVTGELIPRAFVVFVKNTSGEVKSFRLKITEGPQYGQASFLEYDLLDELDVEIAPYSSISRPVFVTSTNETDSVSIEVYEIDTPGGSPVAGSISSDIVLNSDPSALGDSLREETHNPNIINPNIINWDVVNPNIINPNIINPNIINPNIINPNIINPNIINPNIINPNIINPNIINPNIINPNIINPNIINPNIINAGESVDDASITDVQWTVQNLGNTASSYTFKIFAKDSLPEGIYGQLLIYKVHYTPGADPNALSNPCELKNVQSHELILNIINPNIINPNIINPNIINPNIINSSIENATFYLRPSEEAVAVLRLIEPNPEEPKTLQSGEVFRIQSWASNIGVSSTAQAPDSGEEEPEVDSTDLMVLSAELDAAIVGVPYSDTLSATGGDGTYSWSLNPNYLPPGLTYSTAGLISGTPESDPNVTYPHIYSFLVQVLSAQETNTQTVSITVNAADEPNPPLNIQTTDLDDGTKGSYYGATLQATGGEPPYTWEMYSGSLPSALTLDGGGTISGTIVDIANDYNFSVSVTDSLGETDTQALTLTVNEFVELVFHTISGRITDGAPDHNPIPGVILYGLPGAPTTDQDGEYSTSVREGDSFTAEPFRPGYTFSPVSQSYAEVAADMTTEDYTASVLTYTVAGKVTINGIPLPGVVMNGLPGNPETDIDGFYQDTVPHAWSDTVTPTLEGYSFIPSSTTYDPIVVPLIDQDYTASYTGGDVDDEYEDNDNLSQAPIFEPGLHTNLRLLDEDWFKVNVLSGQDIEVSVTGLFNNDIDLALYDSMGDLIMEAITGQEYESVYAANITNGFCYIRILGSAQSVLPYYMTVNVGDLNLGTISGTVTTDEATPVGLESRISVSSPFGSWNTNSNVSGNYSMSLPPGEYQILFERCELAGTYYLPEYHNNKLRGISADWVTLAAGGTPEINAQLEEGGFISGTVTDPYGAAVHMSLVYAWDSDNGSITGTRTDQNGVYIIDELRARNYKLWVRPYTENYASKWYRDKYSFDLADPVHVETALETSEIDFQLEEGGYISGRVTDSIGGGIPNLWVRVYDVTGIYLVGNKTDNQGNYSIPSVPATDVKVLFDAEGTTYISEWHNNIHSPTFELYMYQHTSEEADLVSVQAGQTTGNINAQLDDAGNISGRVTDSQGNPIAQVEVHVFDTSGKFWRTAHTDRYGKYTVDRLPAGSVKVRFRTLYEDYTTVWYPNQNSFSSGETITVTVDQFTDDIDAQLAENGGHITGTVIDSGGEGIEGVLVVAHDSSFPNSPTLVFTHFSDIFDIQDSSIPYSPAWTFTDENGDYNIPRLPTSEVNVEFNADYLWLNYTSEYYNNVPDQAQGTPVSVNAGQTTTGIDATLDDIPPLNILTTSLPDGVAGESYNAILEVEGGQPMYQWTVKSGALPTGLSLDSNGVVSGIPVVDGDFTFDVQVTDSAFTPQTDIQTLSISITPYGGTDKEISGRITSEGSPIQGVLLNGFPNPPTTDASGYYTAMVPLGWTGTVTPSITPDEFTFEPISRTYDEPISANIADQNFEATYTGGDTDDMYDIDTYDNDDLSNAATIAVGTTSNLKLLDDDWFMVNIPTEQDVKITVDGLFANDIDVAVYDSLGTHIIESASGRDNDTVYFVDAVGNYYIQLHYFWEEGLQNIYSLTVETATSFGTGVITGTVTDEGLIPIQADVWVYHEINGWLWRSISDTNGVYTINMPPDDHYKIWFSTRPRYNYEGINYVAEWYDNAFSTAEATTLTVLSGQTVSGIDGQLGPGGSISGHIEDEYGNPLWSQIYVYDYKQKLIASGNPDENGDYTLERIQPGNYKLRFRPDWNHAVQWSGGQNSYAEAHPAPVHAGQTTTGIDIQLHEAGYIEGRVTDTSGNPIQGIWVYAYDESTFYTGMNTLSGNQTDENGNYTLGRLPTSNIKIWFYTWDADGSYITEIFDDKRNLVEGDTIPVFAGETASHDVVELEPGGTFSGRVTDSQGDGLRNVLVWPFRLDNHIVYYNYELTDDNGFYTVKGVPAETKIRFRPPYFGDNAVQWYDGKGSYSTADILAVPQGQTVPNIDAHMPDNGGKIMGRVTDTNGTGIGGVHIHVYDTSLEAHYTSAYTDADGYYTVRRLPTCKLKLHFDTDYRNLDYISEYYNDEATFEGATQIQVQLGQTKNIADVVLEQRPALSISSSGLPNPELAVPYQTAIEVTGGREFYHFSLIGNLPNGLTLNSNGIISGTATVQGTFYFSVEVIDSSGIQQNDIQSLSLTVDPYAGTDYLISGSINFESSPLSGVVMQGLPGNPVTIEGEYIVAVPPGWSGIVRPTLAGYYFDPYETSYTSVNSPQSDQDYAAYELTLEITTDWLPNGMQGEEYNRTLTADGGTQSYSWSIVSDSLPYGLTLDSSGNISGTPTQPDWYEFSVRVIDSSSPSQVVVKNYSIQITWEDLISPGPLLYWKFNDDSDNTAKDSSGKNIRGILHENAVYTADSHEGNAVETYGRGWIDTETWRGDFFFDHEATILAFVKIDDLTSNRMVWKLQYDRTDVGWPYTFEVNLNINQNILSLNSVNGLDEGIENAQHYNLDVDLSAPLGGFSTGAYHQIAVTIQDNVYKIYINGIEVNSGTGALLDFNDWAQNFWIMGADWSETFLNGKIDEVMVFNQTLDLEDVLEIYQGAPFPTISGNISLTNGSPISWVWMDGTLGARTDENGNYTTVVPHNWTGTVTPDGGHYFDPQSRSYENVISDLTAQDYTAYEWGSLWINVSGLPDGTKGQSYSVTLEAQDGIEPYTWNIASGNLPLGVNLNVSTGEISGTPTEAGNFTFTVSVTDSNTSKQANTLELHLNISADHEGFWTTTYPFGGQIHSTGLAIDPSNPNVVFATTGGGGIFKTEDAGASWTNLIDDPDWPYSEWDYSIFIIHQKSGNYYMCTGGYIYKSTDQGLNWDWIYEREEWDIRSITVDPSSASTIYAGTYYGEMFKTIDGGANWVTCGSGFPADIGIEIITVDPNSDVTVYAGTGSNYGLFKSVDSGDSFSPINNNIDFGRIEDIAVKPGDSNIVYVTGWSHSYGEGIFQSTDGGQSWTKKQDMSTGRDSGNAITIDSFDTKIIYGASWESVFKSTDGGSSWTEYSLPSSSSMTESIVIHPTNSLILYAGTHGDGVFKSSDGGLTWTVVNNGIRALSSSNEVNSLEIDESNANYVYSGSIGGGYRSVDGGTNWEKMDFPQGSMTTFTTHPGTPGTVYAGHNSFWKRTYNVNTGAWIDSSWIDPTIPPIGRVSRIDIGMAQDDFPNIIYFGARHSDDTPVGMYRSDNGGTTWILKNNGLTYTDIRTIAVHREDSQTVFAGTELEWPQDPNKDYGLYKTTDGGENWFYKSSGLPGDMYIHQIIIYPNNPDIMYIAGGGDGFCGIYKSMNGGENWEQASNSCADAIAVAPDNPNLLYFADWVGFYVSLNGGSTWMEFNGGLPRVPKVRSIHLDPADPFHVFIATSSGVYEADFVFDFMILTDSLPNGFLNESYNAALEASGGTDPYMWEILSGILPDGLSMASDGTISGTPLALGFWGFTVKATDSSGTPITFQKDINISILNKYTLDVAANPSEGGIVTKDPDLAEYIEGDMVDVSVTIDPNYIFTGWSGDASGKTSLVHVQMTKDKTLTANFADPVDLPDYTINSATLPSAADAGDTIGGSVSVTVDNIGAAASYPNDISVGIYISTNSEITKDDILLWKGRSSITALGAGGTSSVTIDPELQIPTTITAGSYSIGVLVDETDVIAERDETNNDSSQPITIGSSGAGYFDIVGGWPGGGVGGHVIDEARNLAFFANGGNLEILDISDPSNPVLRSQLYLSPEVATSIILSGDFAFISVGGAGFQIVDVSDEYNPELVTTLDTFESAARCVDISGSYAYVTDYHYGLRVFDISNPASPSEIVSLPLPGLSRYIKVKGDYAYITVRRHMTGEGIIGLRIIDISTPSNPVLKSTTEFENALQMPDVDDSGQYLYVPVTGSGVRIFDVSDPTAPSEVSSYEGALNPSEVTIRGNFAYVDDGSEDKAVILDITDPVNPVEVSSYWFDPPFSSFGFDVSDNLWLLGGWAHPIRILDISDKYSPEEAGSYDEIEGMNFHLDISDDYAYIVDTKSSRDGLKVLDISNFSDITKTTKLETPYSIYGIDISNDYAYIAAWNNGVRVFDLSNPSNLVEVAACEEVYNAQSITIVGKYAYVADYYDGLKILDISTPLNPTFVSVCYLPGRTYSVAIEGDYAYVSAFFPWTGLRIIDISDPLNPWEVGTLDFDDVERIRYIAAQDNYVYLTYDRKGCKVIDVSDPENPSEVSSFDAYLPYNITFSGHLLFISNWLYGLTVWDISDPTNPTQADYINEIFLPQQVVIKENLIYVLNRDSGFYVLEYKMP